MRRASFAIVAGACALALVACGGSSGNATSKAAAVHNDFLTFSLCMRSHGVPNFPDPQSGGGIQITPGDGLNPRSPAFQAAQKQCFHLLPGGGSHAGSPADEPRMLALAECMRRHGLTNFPDPTIFHATGGPPAGNVIVANGYEFKLGPGLDPQSPAFQAAAKACGGL
jgi:hypothetical protein